MPASLEELTAAFNTQSDNVIKWLEFLGDDLAGQADKPSALEGWSNYDLVVHIGLCVSTLISSQPSPDGTNPLTLAEYLGTYPNRAEEISHLTHATAQELDVPLGEFVKSQYAAAKAAIAQFGTDEDLVLQARRAPISLRDLVASRVLEIVIHTLDLVYSLRGSVEVSGALNPMDRAALRLAAQELLDIVIARGGFSVEVADAELWVRLASGRLPYNTADLTRAITPHFTAGGVPDMGKMLPVL